MASGGFEGKLKSTADLIRKSHKIIIACHANPDGDAIGSMLGLGLGLIKMGKSITMLCQDRIPRRYAELPLVSRIHRQHKGEADLAISIDCASMLQLSKLERAFAMSQRIVEIDHHTYRTRFGDVQLINRSACSVGEIIFELLKELKIPLDKTIAECLLTSMLVETSSFSRQDVKRVTFDICAQIMDTGVNFRKVSECYYLRKRLASMHLSGLCLVRTKMRANNQLAWSIIYKKDFERFKGKQEDIDPVPDDMMMIEDVKIVLLFREIEGNMLRVSLRSRHGIDIGYLASIYGGGGHHDVAGCRIHNNKRTIEKFINQACSLIYQKTHSRGGLNFQRQGI
ncbi:MAG TPA: DHH family phosphoesterase [Candidatus Omnitrophota bacterium]|nr:DHH family phosphoesterase [Candidatus Omnitrophota bacterium]HPD84473.1 DHH family phosphoesterase [Candidatus Omnitrophota bacterium]HRZ03331.1 DHH family phosphoesterase [Candidatus Omnitrophota bacterium]